MEIKPGSVLAFHYAHHEPVKRRLGKVVYIRDTKLEPLEDSTLRRNPYAERSRYLLLCLMTDGTYRQFYDSGLTDVEKVGTLRRVALFLSGVRFRASADEKIYKVGKVGQRGVRLFNGRIIPSPLQTER